MLKLNSKKQKVIFKINRILQVLYYFINKFTIVNDCLMIEKEDLRRRIRKLLWENFNKICIYVYLNMIVTKTVCFAF